MRLGGGYGDVDGSVNNYGVGAPRLELSGHLTPAAGGAAGNDAAVASDAALYAVPLPQAAPEGQRYRRDHLSTDDIQHGETAILPGI